MDISSSPAIGIDLGTTYSCVAVFQDGKVEVIANDQGSKTTPSFVAFTPEQRLVGEPAKTQAVMNPTNSLSGIKRLIGRHFEDPIVQADLQHWLFEVVNDAGKPKVNVMVKGNPKQFSPEEISAMVLAKMKETAEEYLGKSVVNAVVTVPAYFNDSQRQATKDAGTIAGLHILRLINEPTAAAIAYGLDKRGKANGNILIFDLGGGTFDVSILQITDGIFEVKATSGDTHLGGEDFDKNVVEYLKEQFRRQWNKEIGNNPRAKRRLYKEAEAAKRLLSSCKQAHIVIDALFEGHDFDYTLSRTKFEEINAALFKATLDPVKKALEYAKLIKSQIDEIVLVGGSTRIPKIQQILQEFFDGKKLNKSINPDEAVAYGAAVQAAILNGEQSKELTDLLLLDIVPLSLGIETKDGTFSKLVERCSSKPCIESKTFYTPQDNTSSLNINVYEGERPFATDNRLLGSFVLANLLPAPQGAEILVTFEVDTNGILDVSAVEKSSGNERTITIQNDRGLSTAEITRMIEEADDNWMEDERWRDCFENRNAFVQFCSSLKDAVEKETSRSKVSESERKMVATTVNGALEWLDQHPLVDSSELHSKQEELEEACRPVLLKVYEDDESEESPTKRMRIEDDDDDEATL